MEFKVGDRLKVRNMNTVFVVAFFSKCHKLVPDGWPYSKDGTVYNPNILTKYEGATSVFIRDDNSSDV